MGFNTRNNALITLLLGVLCTMCITSNQFANARTLLGDVDVEQMPVVPVDGESSTETMPLIDENGADGDMMGDTNTADEEGGDAPMLTIAETASGSPDFSTLLAAVAVADSAPAGEDDGEDDGKMILDALADPKMDLTVLAPENEAIVASLEKLGMTQEEFLADPVKLKKILLFHVADKKVLAADLKDGMTIDTMLKKDGVPVPITVSIDGETVKLDPGGGGEMIEVTGADIMASNGVIHKINGVLIPPSDE